MSLDPSNVNFSFVLASAVHDMKNSLSMLLSSLGELMETYPPQTEGQQKTYATLEYEAARINSDLVQLLSLYRLENENFRMHIDEHFVVDVLNEQVARNHVLLATKGLQVEVICDVNLQGYFDMDLLGGVINNILVNAARYSKSRIQLSATQTPQGLCISIEDDGPGFPEEMLSFNEWMETSGHLSNGRPHLGLLFAHKIAGLHVSNSAQGFIKLSNGARLGGGVFQLYIP